MTINTDQVIKRAASYQMKFYGGMDSRECYLEVLREDGSKGLKYFSTLEKASQFLDYMDRENAHAAAFNGELDEVLDYLAEGVDPNDRDAHFGDTLLIDACQEPERDPAGRVVGALLERGAEPNARNADGKTAAHIAAQNGHHSALVLLDQAGADFEAKDSNGNTPACLARGEAARFFAERTAQSMDAQLPAATDYQAAYGARL